MRFTIIILVQLFIAGCAVGVAYSSKGEEIYRDKCGGCHRLYTKTELKSEKLRSSVEEMSKRAKLSTEEKRMIIEYLIDDKKE